MSSISFVSEYRMVTDLDNYSVIIPAVHSKKELLDEYNKWLKFPYFGFNWDALWDLVCDFHWIAQRHIHIYHESVASMPVEDLQCFLEIITDACKSWEKRQQENLLLQKKILYIYFNNKEKRYIQEIKNIQL
jgi:RNAse (barnase) inhibitor barstar